MEVTKQAFNILSEYFRRNGFVSKETVVVSASSEKLKFTFVNRVNVLHLRNSKGILYGASYRHSNAQNSVSL